MSGAAPKTVFVLVTTQGGSVDDVLVFATQEAAERHFGDLRRKAVSDGCHLVRDERDYFETSGYFEAGWMEREVRG